MNGELHIIESHYNGLCGCCGTFYQSGAEIVKVDGYWWLAEHAQREERASKQRPCKKCNLVHAGECF